MKKKKWRADSGLPHGGLPSGYPKTFPTTRTYWLPFAMYRVN